MRLFGDGPAEARRHAKACATNELRLAVGQRFQPPSNHKLFKAGLPVDDDV
jgi:hypothetical protein